MKSFTICALLAAGVSAVPHYAHRHHKRDVVWVTETAVDIVTDVVVQTVFVDGSGHPIKQHPTGGYSAPAYSAPASSSAESAPTTTSSAASIETPIATSTTTSAYQAPTTTTTTSAYQAPTTSTSDYVPTTSTTTSDVYSAPPTTTTTSAYVPATTTSAAAPTATGYGATYVGDMTFYDPSVGTGACGMINSTADYVVAMNHNVYSISDCQRWISITYGGQTINAEVVDLCPGCKGTYGLDLSPGLFAAFTPTAAGVMPSATWSYMN